MRKNGGPNDENMYQIPINKPFIAKSLLRYDFETKI